MVVCDGVVGNVPTTIGVCDGGGGATSVEEGAMGVWRACAGVMVGARRMYLAGERQSGQAGHVDGRVGDIAGVVARVVAGAGVPRGEQDADTLRRELGEVRVDRVDLVAPALELAQVALEVGVDVRVAIH